MHFSYRILFLFELQENQNLATSERHLVLDSMFLQARRTRCLQGLHTYRKYLVVCQMCLYAR